MKKQKPSIKYECPKCKKKNEPSGMCASRGYQIICKDCKIMYYPDGSVDELLTGVLNMKPTTKSSKNHSKEERGGMLEGTPPVSSPSKSSKAKMFLKRMVGYVDSWNVRDSKDVHPSHRISILEVADAQTYTKLEVDEVFLSVITVAKAIKYKRDLIKVLEKLRKKEFETK